MFTVQFDLSALERMSGRVGGAIDQMPYALSRSLNDSVFKARQVLVTQTWPSAVTARNASFISAALRVEKATKGNLRVEIADVLGRGNLQQHARGGVSVPRKVSNFAIPAAELKSQRGARGMPVRLSPRSIISRTPPRALRVTQRGIFVGEGGRLHLKYSFARSVTISATARFYEDFEYVMRESMRTGFPDAMRQAMATRR